MRRVVRGGGARRAQRGRVLMLEARGLHALRRAPAGAQPETALVALARRRARGALGDSGGGAEGRARDECEAAQRAGGCWRGRRCRHKRQRWRRAQGARTARCRVPPGSTIQCCGHRRACGLACNRARPPRRANHPGELRRPARRPRAAASACIPEQLERWRWGQRARARLRLQQLGQGASPQVAVGRARPLQRWEGRRAVRRERQWRN